MMKQTALLVLDLINDVVHPDSPIASASSCVAEKNLILNTNHLIEHIRKQRGLIIFFRVGFSASYIECPTQPWSLFRGVREPRAYELGQWGTEFHPDLALNNNDTVLVKHRISPFYSTELEAILRAQCVSRLILTGVSTDYVIQSCAREAHDRDYDTVVVENLCAASTHEIHDQAIASLKRLVNVVHSSELQQE
ncbi:cysteine hydrolase [Endozoicomonas numazuensis]|uniref:Isochorismatase-like domain-containing protein n=1 Tax=Endozoicomonas numazuensis TaxID=1137799 RepID=A0A081NG75_9GAMM|nr:cysteine hydrolase [Endozoicomonas numazuensis]KEQ17448.1 hypothetical protein GZ78_16875 [Endozoicomonas numazuensis]